MSAAHSITRLLPGVKEAEDTAVHAFFAKVYSRVVSIARRGLGSEPRRGFDEHDVANSALLKLLERAAAGELLKLESREDVWQILTLFVGDKIAERLQFAHRLKRGGPMGELQVSDLDAEVDATADPALEAEFEDAKKAFLGALPSDEHRRIIGLLLDGHSRERIAEMLGMSERTVYRKLETTSSVWRRFFEVRQQSGERSDEQ